ncbi:MAG TPA: GNAT family N-acyltransferase [Yinghuangia sp.]|nr:GNAT family N-acyltransferase [Yinghuangia sp.]
MSAPAPQLDLAPASAPASATNAFSASGTVTTVPPAVVPANAPAKTSAKTSTKTTASATARPAVRYTVGLARDAAEIRAAQRLRHRVFAEEMGADLRTPEPGLDTDGFDAFCDHLVVREEASGEVVGTYRLMPPERARAAGGLYAAGEFALHRHIPLHSDLVEVGRSCVHPDHREGAVIGLMWAGIARYLADTGHNWLAGCCSVPLDDGGAQAADVRAAVRRKYLAPEEYRVTPYSPWVPDAALESAERPRTPLPPLLRGYLRLGAWVCGEPAHDTDFGAADFYVLLSLRRTDPRYLRRFLAMDSA